MFEAAELGRKLSKAEFEKIEPELHTALLAIQRDLLNTNIPVILIVSGVEGAGKGEVVNRLNKWLDTRGIGTTAFWDESDEEKRTALLLAILAKTTPKRKYRDYVWLMVYTPYYRFCI